MNYITKLEAVTNFWIQQSKNDLEKVIKTYRVDLLPEEQRRTCLERLTAQSDTSMISTIGLHMREDVSFDVLTTAASRSFENLEKIANLYCKVNEGHQNTKTTLSRQREALSSLSLDPLNKRKEKDESSLLTTFLQGKMGRAIEKLHGTHTSRSFSFLANLATQSHDTNSEHPVRDSLVSAGVPVAIEEAAGSIVEGPGFYVVIGADILDLGAKPLERKAKAYLRRPECQHHMPREHENCSIIEIPSHSHPEEHCFDPCESAETLLLFAQTARIPGKLLKKTEHVAKEVISSCLTKCGITGDNLRKLLEKMEELKTDSGYLPE